MLFLLLILLPFFFSYHTLQRSPGSKGRSSVSKFRTKMPMKKNNLKRKLLRRLEQFGFDVIGVSGDDDTLAFFTNKEEIMTLKRSGFELISIDDSDGDIAEEYLTLDQINNYMIEIEREYPSIAKVFDLFEENGMEGEKTYEGRTILGLKLQKDEEENELPNILMVANHHAREIVTPEIIIGVMDVIVDHRQDFLDSYNFYLIPVVNPDGYEYVLSDDEFWRKNRRKYDDTDCVGVDLNRNYDVAWNIGDCDETTTCSETYPGTEAFSEPETSGISNLMHEMKFAKVLDFHSFGREVLWGYTECAAEGFTYPREMYDYMSVVAEDLASQIDGFETRKPHGPGEHQEYEVLMSTTYSFLVEVAESFQPDHEDALKEVEIVYPLIEYFISYPIPLWGVVRDGVTSDVALYEVEVDVEELDMSYFTRTTDKRGLYHLFLPDGKYTIVFRKEGYEDYEMEVEFANGKERKIDIEMMKPEYYDDDDDVEGDDLNIRKRRRRKRRERRRRY